jgi:hypothetical protein
VWPAQYKERQEQRQGKREQPSLTVPEPLEQGRGVLIVGSPAIRQPSEPEQWIVRPVPGQDGKAEPAHNEPEEEWPARIGPPPALGC